MTIGTKIKTIRLQKGMTQKELAEKTGINDANIRKYESGRQNPKLETIAKIAKALEVPIDVLSGYEIVDGHIVSTAFSKRTDKGITFVSKISGYSKTSTSSDYLLEHYNKLNSLGKEKAIERVEELTEIEKYTKPDE